MGNRVPHGLAKVGYTEEDLSKLADPLWRLSNLYRITDKEGNVVPFRPNVPQQVILDDIYRKGIKRVVVLKARRMGFSTLFELIALDTTYFNENVQASIVDLTQKDASKKLTEKCGFAYQGIPAALFEKPKNSNNSELSFQNNSSINAGTHARGGTNQFLHISEWGPIAYEDPKRSEEIKTGAIPSADCGVICIESTFKGGKGGHFYEIIKKALETPDELKTDKDFYFRFFPWYMDKRHSISGRMERVGRDTHKYLDELERTIGEKITDGQRLWYQVTKDEQGIFMLREYPSTVEEAFRAPVEGAIYGKIIDQQRAAGMVSVCRADMAYPIYTSFDIGHSDTTDIWWFQMIGNEMRWLKHVTLHRSSAAEAAHVIQQVGYPITCNFVPHDADSGHANTGTSYRQELEKAGLERVKVVPRTHDIWVGINQLCDLFKRSRWDAAECKDGIAGLEAYHTDVNKLYVSEPVHDWSSHPSDAARTAAEAIACGLLASKAARKVVESTPRMPDGTIVIPELREVRRRSAMALGGHLPL